MSDFPNDYNNNPPPPTPTPRKVPTPPVEPTTKQRLQERQKSEVETPIPQAPLTPEPPEVSSSSVPQMEYDEERELRAKMMPRIDSFATKQEQMQYMYGPEATEEEIVRLYGAVKYREGLREVVVTPGFNIQDVHIKDVKNQRVIGTFVILWLNPFSQVLPMEIQEKDTEDKQKQKRIIYQVLMGQGHLTIGNLTKSIMKSDIFFVEPNVEHNFFNTAKGALVLWMFYDGHVDLRDRYFPKHRVQEISKESKREIFDVRTQRNRPVETTTHSPSQNATSRSEERFT